jgi:hypothetical protein
MHLTESGSRMKSSALMTGGGEKKFMMGNVVSQTLRGLNDSTAPASQGSVDRRPVMIVNSMCFSMLCQEILLEIQMWSQIRLVWFVFVQFQSKQPGKPSHFSDLGSMSDNHRCWSEAPKERQPNTEQN